MTPEQGQNPLEGVQSSGTPGRSPWQTLLEARLQPPYSEVHAAHLASLLTNLRERLAASSQAEAGMGRSGGPDAERLQALTTQAGSLRNLALQVEQLRALTEERALQAEAALEELRSQVSRLGSSRAETATGHDLQALEARLARVERWQESGIAQLLATRLEAGAAAVEEEGPGGEAAVSAPSLQAVVTRLSRLAQDLPQLGPRLQGDLDAMRALQEGLELEDRLRERAGEILRQLLPRLLDQQETEGLLRRARHLLFVGLPDLVEDLEELGRRDLGPAELGHLHQALEDVLGDSGLEELRPARGESLKAAEHTLLRVERKAEPGLEGLVASCLRPGLRLRATGEVIRKAEVSVYP